jgi:hypothetical protein
MGNYSWLLAAINGADACRIKWDMYDVRLFEGIGGYDAWHIAEAKRKKATTLVDVAHELHDTKLFGYLTDSFILALLELCNCLEMPQGMESCKPKIFYEEEGFDRVHFLEFTPGTRIIVWGTYSVNDEEFKEGGAWYYTDERDKDKPMYVGRDYALLTDEKEASFSEARKRVLGKVVNEGTRWVVNRLSPCGHSRVSALPVFMQMFGIRPEDSDAMERARRIMDVDKLSKTPLDQFMNNK